MSFSHIEAFALTNATRFPTIVYLKGIGKIFAIDFCLLYDKISCNKYLLNSISNSEPFAD